VTLHGLIEHIKYFFVAKSRHGIHSPFVYEFIEKVILIKGTEAKSETYEIINYQNNPAKLQLRPKQLSLLKKMISRYEYKKILHLPADTDSDPLMADILLVDAEPKVWIRLFNMHLPTLSREGCIVLTNIHQTKRHTGKWNRLRNHPQVKLSLDLFSLGILFFRPEFKEKQHFVLRF